MKSTTKNTSIRRVNENRDNVTTSASTQMECFLPKSGTHSFSSHNYYDVLYEYLRSTNFAESERTGSVEVVPPLTAVLGDSLLQTSQELAILHTTTVYVFSSERFDSNGKKLLVSWPESYADAAGLLMGIYHFNNGIGRVVKEVAAINETCNVRLTTDLFDSEHSETTAVNALMDRMLSHPDRFPSSVFGSSRSSVSIPLAILTGIYDIPQISPVSTSKELDRRDQFKTFSRLIPSDATTSRAIVDYFRIRLNVTHCGVLYVDDAYGAGYHEAFKENAANRPKDDRIVVRSFGFSKNNREELIFAVSQMKNLGFRVFLAVIHRYHFDTVMTEAYRLGIAGPGYIWISSDGITEEYLSNRQFPKGSPLAIAIQGFGIIMARGGLSTSSGDSGYDRFLDAWYDQGDESVSYCNCKMPKNNTMNNADKLYYKADPGLFKPDRRMSPTSSAAFFYDSAVGLGLAACRLKSRNDGDSDYFDGKDLYNEFIRSSFEGATGKIKIEPETGSRDHTSAFFVLYNANGVENGKNVSFEVSIVAHTVENPDNSSVLWRNLDEKAFIYSDGTMQPPPVLPPIEGEELNQLRNVIYGGLVLSIVILLSSLFFAVWTCRFRDVRVIKAAQPPFLIMICFGTFMMGTSIVTFSIDDRIASIQACNIACMATPWLLTLGFVVVFSAMFSKIWRINRILLHQSYQRIQVKIKDVILPFLILLTLNTIVLLVWTLVSPLKWERITKEGTDRFGRPLESYGRCSFQQNIDRIYFLLILIINVPVVISANVQAYRSREIKTEYSEAKYIATVNMIILQTFIVGIPIIFLVDENPPAFYFVYSGLVFVLCTSMLFLIFVPKISSQRAQRNTLQNVIARRNTTLGF